MMLIRSLSRRKVEIIVRIRLMVDRLKSPSEKITGIDVVKQNAYNNGRNTPCLKYVCKQSSNKALCENQGCNKARR